MLRVSPSPVVLRRALAVAYHRQRLPHRRYLHEDSSRGSDFLNLTITTPHLADPRFGMDLTRAPGYEVAADDDPPLVPRQKVVDFAVRHARLSSTQVDHADGYIWVGHVLYPSGVAPDPDIAFSWEIVRDDLIEMDEDDPDASPPVDHDDDVSDSHSQSEPPVEAKKHIPTAQARRIRRERLRTATRKAQSLAKSHNHKPHSDTDSTQDDEDS